MASQHHAVSWPLWALRQRPTRRLLSLVRCQVVQTFSAERSHCLEPAPWAVQDISWGSVRDLCTVPVTHARTHQAVQLRYVETVPVAITLSLYSTYYTQFIQLLKQHIWSEENPCQNLTQWNFCLNALSGKISHLCISQQLVKMNVARGIKETLLSTQASIRWYTLQAAEMNEPWVERQSLTSACQTPASTLLHRSHKKTHARYCKPSTVLGL